MKNGVERDESQRAGQSNTFESDILKSVIREAWKEELGKGKPSKELMHHLDEHASSMRKILNTFDYEIASMPLIVSNAMRMSHGELAGYLSHLEAIATGYSSVLGPEITNLIMLGVPRKAKDAKSAREYSASMISMIERRHGRYASRIARENKAIGRISEELSRNNSNVILRLFKKGRIVELKRDAKMRFSRLSRLESGAARYVQLLDAIKEKSEGAKPLPHRP